jgi:hypothetical protein
MAGVSRKIQPFSTEHGREQPFSTEHGREQPFVTE